MCLDIRISAWIAAWTAAWSKTGEESHSSWWEMHAADLLRL